MTTKMPTTLYFWINHSAREMTPACSDERFGELFKLLMIAGGRWKEYDVYELKSYVKASSITRLYDSTHLLDYNTILVPRGGSW